MVGLRTYPPDESPVGLERVPAVDSTLDTVERDVLGNKGDSLVTSEPAGASDTKSIVAWLKGIISLVRFILSKPLAGVAADSLADQVFLAVGFPFRSLFVAAKGTASAGSTTTLTDVTGLGSAVTDYYKGMALLMLSGSNAGLQRTISAYNGSTHVLTVQNAFPASIANTDKYVVRPSNGHLAASVDDAGGITTNQSLGNKGDTAANAAPVGGADTLSVFAWLKHVVNLVRNLILGGSTATVTVTAAGGTAEVSLITDTTSKGNVRYVADLSNLTQNGTMTVYERVDGTNERALQVFAAVNPTVDPKSWFWQGMVNASAARIRIGWKPSVAEAADRSVPVRTILDGRA